MNHGARSIEPRMAQRMLVKAEQPIAAVASQVRPGEGLQPPNLLAVRANGLQPEGGAASAEDTACRGRPGSAAVRAGHRSLVRNSAALRAAGRLLRVQRCRLRARLEGRRWRRRGLPLEAQSAHGGTHHAKGGESRVFPTRAKIGNE